VPLQYLTRRLIQFGFVLWGAATLNFLIPRLAPGNPVRERLMGAMQTTGPMQQGIEEMVRSYNIQFGLDQPLYVQYFKYMGRLCSWTSGIRSPSTRSRSCRSFSMPYRGQSASCR
jgi:peptide/nickel transport system permease protein